MAIQIAAIDLATGIVKGVTAATIDSAGVIGSSTIIVGGTNSLKSDRLSLPGAGGDPGLLSAGDVYYRTDTATLKFKGAGSNTLLHDSTAFAGDVTGTSGAMVVAQLQGDAINAAIAPNDGDVLTWDNASSHWDAAARVLAGTADGQIHFPNSVECTFGDTLADPELRIYSSGAGHSYIMADTYLNLMAGATQPLLVRANQLCIGINTDLRSANSGNAYNWQIKAHAPFINWVQVANIQNSATSPYMAFGNASQYRFHYDGTTYFDGIITFADTQGVDTYTAVNDLFDLRAYDTTGAARLNAIRIQNSAGGTAKLGFFNGGPVVKPVGVAVTAVGIHAALVSLGLIAGP